MPRRVLFASIAALLLTALPSFAYNQNPNLNIGYSNVLDAIIPPPGVYLNGYLVYYHSDDLKDGKGGKLPGKNELEVLAFAPQMLWVSSKPIAGRFKWGAQALLPIVNIDMSSNIGLKASNKMLGDLAAGLFLGSSVEFGNGWSLYWFTELDVFMPVGQYDNKYALNPGANHWTVEPFISLTLLMPHGFAFSTRQHFTYNTTNHDYLPPGASQTVDLQPGSAWHFNYSFTKSLDFIDPNLRIGVGGYYIHQLEEDEINGNSLRDSEERVFAAGPSIFWMRNGFVLSLKAYFESGAENRPEGQRFVLRAIIPF